MCQASQQTHGSIVLLRFIFTRNFEVRSSENRLGNYSTGSPPINSPTKRLKRPGVHSYRARPTLVISFAFDATPFSNSLAPDPSERYHNFHLAFKLLRERVDAILTIPHKWLPTLELTRRRTPRLQVSGHLVSFVPKGYIFSSREKYASHCDNSTFKHTLLPIIFKNLNSQYIKNKIEIIP